MLLALLVLAAIGCTPVREVGEQKRTLTVTVTADPEVQAELDDIEVLVESRTRGSASWRVEQPRRFTPDPAAGSGWPLRLTIDEHDPRATYQATATARDSAGAIIMQARTIADPNLRATEDLQLRFDRECLRRSTLCGKTLTCSLGECVDAHEPLVARSTDNADQPTTDAGIGSTTLGATALDACSIGGERTCARDQELQPLICEDGMWRNAASCTEMTRCDDSSAQTHGTCQPIIAECATRAAGDRYCDAAGQMFECQANRSALAKTCGDNEHCVDSAGEVQCECLFGFVPAAQGCSEPIDCRDMGGCDGQTQCVMRAGKPSCTECPPGFSGNGQIGCSPLLSDLQISPGTLDPPFAPETTRYTLRVPLLTERISLEAGSTVSAELLVNNSPAMLGTKWTSSVLAPGQTELPITLRVATGGRTDYQITVDHSVARQTYVKAADSHAGDLLGAYLGADGDTVVAGAPRETVDGVPNAGAVYVFVRTGGTWRQQARLTAPAPAEDDLFGVSAAISGERIVAGRPGNIFSSISAGERAGSALVFVRTGDVWSLEQEIKSDDARGGDRFGFSAVLNQDVLVLGAPMDDEGALNSGAAYVFARSGSSWQQQARLKAANPQSESHFGTMLGFDGKVVAVCAWQETVGASTWAGAVYTYQKHGDDWTAQGRLTAPTVRPMALFGAAIAVRGDTLVIAAPHNPPETTSSNRSGEVHVFKREGAEYRAVQLLEAPQPAVGDRFGNHVVLSSARLIVGAPGANGSQTGGAYLYVRADDRFVRTADLRAMNADEQDQFGYAVTLTDDFAVVAALYEDGETDGIGEPSSSNSLADSGAVYIFE